ncbi:hypothetical protein AVEN_209573-1 [Araneus ventricosus]|uniref:Uncharacterized protein n=1 Tax=Araneus ventricosus TaxID=182803 RepID=A0A4Y2UYQ3_ARAVE|nr:hypothetical protein AVEN_209573-1 [Araneus ventricosus]
MVYALFYQLSRSAFDGDDIFSIADPLSSDKTASSSSKPTSTAATKKEAEKKPVDLFDDPLSGLLGDD